MSLQAGIRKTGYITLDDGMLVCSQDLGNGNRAEIGRILVGVDGLYFDGFEPIFCQKDDPAKIRLASRGTNVGGEVTFSRLREDDKMEELVRISGERADGTNDDLGQFRVSIRTGGAVGGGDYKWEPVFVGTTAFVGKVWTGAANWVGWLWKLATPGATPPPPNTTGRVTQVWSDDGVYLTQPQGDGNFVGYKLTLPYDSHTATPIFDWFSIKDKLRRLEDVEKRLEVLERLV